MRYGTNNRPAVELFRRALERDPRFAQAHAEIASAIALRGMWRLNVTPAEIEEAMEASRRALELEPLLPEAYVARACLLSMEGKDAAAVEDFEQAIRLNRPRTTRTISTRGTCSPRGGSPSPCGSTRKPTGCSRAITRCSACTTARCASWATSRASKEIAVRAMDAIDRQLRLDPTMRGRCSSGP